MLKIESQSDLKVLTGLFERTQRGDQAARVLLQEWFDSRTATMREGKEARLEMSTLAYLMAEKLAARKLAPGGQYKDLPNDPASVASRHWVRFQPFCEDVEAGKAKTVDEFVGWVNKLIKFVLADIAEERNKVEEGVEPFIEGGDADEFEEDDEPTGDYPEWLEEKRALLRRIFQVLPPHLFIVLILKQYCGFKSTQMAEILGTTPYIVKRDFTEATKLIGRLMP